MLNIFLRTHLNCQLKTWAAEDAKMNKAKTQDEARMNQAKAKLVSETCPIEVRHSS